MVPYLKVPSTNFQCKNRKKHTVPYWAELRRTALAEMGLKWPVCTTRLWSGSAWKNQRCLIPSDSWWLESVFFTHLLIWVCTLHTLTDFGATSNNQLSLPERPGLSVLYKTLSKSCHNSPAGWMARTLWTNWSWALLYLTAMRANKAQQVLWIWAVLLWMYRRCSHDSKFSPQPPSDICRASRNQHAFCTSTHALLLGNRHNSEICR